MLTLVIGLVLFLGVHLVPTNVALRRDLGRRFGEAGFKTGFALVSLIGLALVIYGFAKVQGLPGKNPQLWVPPVWTKHVTWLLMWPAFILLVAAETPSRIRTAVGHPMLLAVKLWAVAHLLANGRLAHVALFGSFLAWAVVDLISAKRRHAMGPMGDKPGTLGGDIAAILLGTLLYVGMLHAGHQLFIGVPLLP